MTSIPRLLAIRDASLARGDRNLAMAAQIELNRRGYVEVETILPEVREQAVPAKRPRGRPRKTPAPDVA